MDSGLNVTPLQRPHGHSVRELVTMIGFRFAVAGWPYVVVSEVLYTQAVNIVGKVPERANPNFSVVRWSKSSQMIYH